LAAGSALDKLTGTVYNEIIMDVLRHIQEQVKIDNLGD
jgi:hypothetical protein